MVLFSWTRLWLHASLVSKGLGSSSELTCAVAGEEVRRVDASTLRPGDLIEKVTEPVVLTNLADSWPATRIWSTEYLATEHGHNRVSLLKLPEEVFHGDNFSSTVGNSLYADHVRNAYVPFVRMPEQPSLAEYIRHKFSDYVFDIGDNSVALRVCVDAFGSPEELPELLAADDLTQLTFGMGPAKDGVMLHAHTATWNALMMGEKEWFFYKPDGFKGEAYERLSMLSATKLAEALGLQGGEPMENLSKPVRVRQRAGEVVYIPDGWWHGTYSHTDTACIGGQRHKERLPRDWGERLLERWPESGIFLNAVAKERSDPLLFEEAIEREPVNLRFSTEYMTFLRDKGEYAKAVKVALNLKSEMEKACEQGFLGRAEFAAVLASLAEVLYYTVETASIFATLGHLGSGGEGAQAAFAGVMQVSFTAHSFIKEALMLDPGCSLAQSLDMAIETRSKKADFKKLPPGLLSEEQLKLAQTAVPQLQAPPEKADIKSLPAPQSQAPATKTDIESLFEQFKSAETGAPQLQDPSKKSDIKNLFEQLRLAKTGPPQLQAPSKRADINSLSPGRLEDALLELVEELGPQLQASAKKAEIEALPPGPIKEALLKSAKTAAPQSQAPSEKADTESSPPGPLHREQFTLAEAAGPESQATSKTAAIESLPPGPIKEALLKLAGAAVPQVQEPSEKADTESSPPDPLHREQFILAEAAAPESQATSKTAAIESLPPGPIKEALLKLAGAAVDQVQEPSEKADLKSLPPGEQLRRAEIVKSLPPGPIKDALAKLVETATPQSQAPSEKADPESLPPGPIKEALLKLAGAAVPQVQEPSEKADLKSFPPGEQLRRADIVKSLPPGPLKDSLAKLVEKADTESLPPGPVKEALLKLAGAAVDQVQEPSEKADLKSLPPGEQLRRAEIVKSLPPGPIKDALAKLVATATPQSQAPSEKTDIKSLPPGPINEEQDEEQLKLADTADPQLQVPSEKADIKSLPFGLLNEEQLRFADTAIPQSQARLPFGQR